MSPTTAIELCKQMWGLQPLNMAGWEKTSWECSNDNSSFTVLSNWKRQNGHAINAPGTLKGNTDVESTQTTTGKFSGAVGITDPIHKHDLAIRALWTFSEQLGIKATVGGGEKPSTPALPGMISEDHPKKIEQKPWDETRFSFVMNFPPFMSGFSEKLAQVSVVHVTTVRWDSGNWYLDGVLYSQH